ncbi:DUF7344 domain-containing protein [Halovivax cerinus]|uniref:DUF7344 domain-containing protein n=1 Tax=Halovivax cerinus TaxID=1487865 RepID=A0ABD5NM57_9EURY|nr:hypothetical protein [Halovivax cerinus]
MSLPPVQAVDDSELLTHRDRRQLCAILAASGPLPISVLAERLVERAGSRSFDDPTAARVALCHNHLPRLRDRGIVDYEPGDETVCISDRITFEVDEADLVTVVSDSRTAEV